MVPSQITDQHLQRHAVAYLRQATGEPVQSHPASPAIQRDLPKLLQNLGWPADRIITITDWGVSGLAKARPGFRRLIKEMTAGRVGLVVVSDVSRLGRNPTDLARFMTTAQQHDVLVLLGDGQRVIDLRDPHTEFLVRIQQIAAMPETKPATSASALRASRKPSRSASRPGGRSASSFTPATLKTPNR